jgi:hypothetical protein
MAQHLLTPPRRRRAGAPGGELYHVCGAGYGAGRRGQRAGGRQRIAGADDAAAPVAWGWILPLFVRYQAYLGGVLQGDLGRSLIGNRAVSQLLLERLPYTLLLAVAAASLALLVGGMIGTVAALRAGRWLDTVLMGGVAVGLAVPVFWSALLLMLLFSLKLHWLPVVGASSWRHLILPMVVLAIPTCGYRGAAGALQPARRARCRLRAHRAGQGAAPAPRPQRPRLPQQPAARANGGRAATWVTCSAARSWSKPSSGGRGWGG